MLREGVPIGLLVLTRSEVQPFTDKQIELVTTYADQAAIAIENVRLFEAEQERTHELTKSLEDLRQGEHSSKVGWFTLPTQPPIPNIHWSKRGDWATTVQFCASQCCARASRSVYWS